MDLYESPLTTAVKKNLWQRVRFLLESGVNANEIDATGLSPLYRAIRESKLTVLRAFLEKVDITNIVDDDANSPLVAAIRSDASIDIIQCLLDRGADINENHHARTPLAWAAQIGNEHVVKFLVERGADVNLMSRDGNSPLANAVWSHQPKVAHYLITCNAQINKFEHAGVGKSPLHWAIRGRHWHMTGWLLDLGVQIDHDAFLTAVETGHQVVVERLISRGARVTTDEVNILETPLQRAVYRKDHEMARFLIQNGARVGHDLQHLDVLLTYQFMMAGEYAMMAALVEGGARVNLTPDCSDGETILTRALLDEKFIAVKCLLENGADANLPNLRGRRPIVIAEANDDFQSFHELMNHGALVSEEDRKRNRRMGKYFKQVMEARRHEKFRNN